MKISKKINIQKNKKGFTLIELLIVIAIIGILASVVLVSLSSARDKARAANFKSQVAALQAKAMIACDSSTGLAITAADLGNAKPGQYGITIQGNNCGPTGAGTFNVRINSGVSTVACNGTITDTGATFSGC